MDDSALFATRQSLLLRLKDHADQEGWREFFDTYWRMIYAFCLKAGLTEVEAEEVADGILDARPGLVFGGDD